MDPVIDRISKIVSDLRMSDRAFESSINKSSGYLNALRKKNSSPSVKVVLDIANTHTDYNLLWILTGNGPMKTKEAMLNEPETHYNISIERNLKKLNQKLDAVKKQNEKILKQLDLAKKKS